MLLTNVLCCCIKNIERILFAIVFLFCFVLYGCYTNDIQRIMFADVHRILYCTVAISITSNELCLLLSIEYLPYFKTFDYSVMDFCLLHAHIYCECVITGMHRSRRLNSSSCLLLSASMSERCSVAFSAAVRRRFVFAASSPHTSAMRCERCMDV